MLGAELLKEQAFSWDEDLDLQEAGYAWHTIRVN